MVKWIKPQDDTFSSPQWIKLPFNRYQYRVQLGFLWKRMLWGFQIREKLQSRALVLLPWSKVMLKLAWTSFGQLIFFEVRKSHFPLGSNESFAPLENWESSNNFPLWLQRESLRSGPNCCRDGSMGSHKETSQLLSNCPHCPFVLIVSPSPPISIWRMFSP